VTAIVLDNWAAIYFLAVTIKTKETSEKYLCKVACTVISLMNERSVADVDSSIDFDQAIESAELDPDDAVEEVYDDQSEASPPTFYLMLLWNRAFCDYAFNPNWRFILKEDPYFDHLDNVLASWPSELSSSTIKPPNLNHHWIKTRLVNIILVDGRPIQRSRSIVLLYQECQRIQKTG